MERPLAEPTIPDVSALSQTAAPRAPWRPQPPAANGHARGAEPAHGTARPDVPVPDLLLPGGRQSLSGISSQAFVLGLALGLSMAASLYLLARQSSLWRSPFFIAILSLFHFLEFYTTARYNTAYATTSAFLLTSNGVAYNAAHTLAMLETTISHGLFPYSKYLPDLAGPYVLSIGFTLVIIGQLTRSMAMIQAGKNFNHTVQMKRAAGHELVTTGIYGTLRHPSYFGFFWWGLGSQMILGNPLCFVAYAAVLWKFFSVRIRKEEQLLTKFFGEDYVLYQRRTRVGIPFVR